MIVKFLKPLFASRPKPVPEPSEEDFRNAARTIAPERTLPTDPAKFVADLAVRMAARICASAPAETPRPAYVRGYVAVTLAQGMSRRMGVDPVVAGAVALGETLAAAKQPFHMFEPVADVCTVLSNDECTAMLDAAFTRWASAPSPSNLDFLCDQFGAAKDAVESAMVLQSIFAK